MHVETHAGRAARSRSGASLYLLTWVAVAAFGLGYIGVAATRPEVLGSILPLAEPGSEQGLAGRQAGDLAEELIALRKWVHELQHDLAAARSTMQEQAAHNAAIVQRLAAAEERLGALREVREPAAKAPPVKATRAQAPALPIQQPATTVAQAAQPAEPASNTANVRILNGAVAPIETGSVPEAKPVPAPPASTSITVTRPAPAPVSPRAIEIGSADSLDSLKARWGEIAGRNADVVGSLAPRYRLFSDGRAAPFTLLAGPFDKPEDAARTCNALRAKGVVCRVTPYGGNAL
jgi:hypothetical protein